jgi:hypothetical protein
MVTSGRGLDVVKDERNIPETVLKRWTSTRMRTRTRDLIDLKVAWVAGAGLVIDRHTEKGQTAYYEDTRESRGDARR